MCTVSVVSRDNDYVLAMNRDERIARSAGDLPEVHSLDETSVIYPDDGQGGAWICVNEYGIALALLNWNDVVRRTPDGGKARSRGQVIPALGRSSSMAELRAEFGLLDLEGISPFRLVGVFPSERAIGEWRWDSVELAREAHEWESRHWFSSSLSDAHAENFRGAACRNAQTESDAGTAPWLRRLHASHAGGPGPFSLCVHREDVRTLSYSEIACTPAGVEMAHFRGSPCAMGEPYTIELERTRRSDSHVWDVGVFPV